MQLQYIFVISFYTKKYKKNSSISFGKLDCHQMFVLELDQRESKEQFLIIDRSVIDTV